MKPRLIAELEERLREIDEEREHIIVLLQFAHKSAGRGENRTDGKSLKRTRRRARSEPPERESVFESIPGGPTASIIKVLASASDGLTYSDVVDRASRIVNTTAKDPRATVAASIHGLTKRGKIIEQDGKYFLPD